MAAVVWYCDTTVLLGGGGAGKDTNDGSQITQGVGNIGPRLDVGYALRDMEAAVEASGEPGSLWLGNGSHSNSGKYGRIPLRADATLPIYIRSLNVGAPADYIDVKNSVLGTGHGLANLGTGDTYGFGGLTLTTRLLYFYDVNFKGGTGFASYDFREGRFDNCHIPNRPLGFNGLGDPGLYGWYMDRGANVTWNNVSVRGCTQGLVQAGGYSGGEGSFPGIDVGHSQFWCLYDPPALIKKVVTGYTDITDNSPNCSVLGGAGGDDSWILIGSKDPLKRWFFGDTDGAAVGRDNRVVNTNAVTMTAIETYNGATWDSQAFTDGTVADGKTMAIQAGGWVTLTTVPSNAIAVRASDPNILGANKPAQMYPYPLYWWRVKFSGPLSAATSAWVHCTASPTNSNANKDAIRMAGGAQGATIHDCIVMGAGDANMDLQCKNIKVQRCESYSARTSLYKTWNEGGSGPDDGTVIENCLAVRRTNSMGREVSTNQPYAAFINNTIVAYKGRVIQYSEMGATPASVDTVRNNVIHVPVAPYPGNIAFGSSTSVVKPICDHNLMVEEGAENLTWWEASKGGVNVGQTVAQAKADPSSWGGVWTADAMFVDALEGDFRLATGSPGLGIGTETMPAYIDFPLTDLLGNDRNAGGVVDAGCYQTQTGLVNHPPTAPTVCTIAPSSPVDADPLVATVSGSTDEDDDELTYFAQWRKSTDGGLSWGAWGYEGATLAAALTTEGDWWQMRGRAWDATDYGSWHAPDNHVIIATVANAIPTTPTVCTIAPDPPSVTDTLTATVSGSTDADPGDTVTYLVQWAVSTDAGANYGAWGNDGATLLPVNFGAGNWVKARVRATDGKDFSAYWAPDNHVVVATPPVISDSEAGNPSQAYIGATGETQVAIELRDKATGLRTGGVIFVRHLLNAADLPAQLRAKAILAKAALEARLGANADLDEAAGGLADLIDDVNA